MPSSRQKEKELERLCRELNEVYSALADKYGPGDLTVAIVAKLCQVVAYNAGNERQLLDLIDHLTKSIRTMSCEHYYKMHCR